MPTARKLPAPAALLRLRRQGWTLQDIADHYGVSASAVWRALERAGFATAGPTYRDLLPWRIAPEHAHTSVMKHFRALARLKDGRELGDAEQDSLDRWLDALERDGVVVNYHPEAPANAASSKGGFYYTPRGPADTWIIREPVQS